MEKKIRCSECENCEEYRRWGNSRSRYTCGHPDKAYILDYFQEHGIQKMAGFMAYGKPGKVPVKTSPAWCPKKRKEA